MGLVKKWREFREYQQRSLTIEELLLSVGVSTDYISKDQALNIPSVSACVEIISNTIAMIPIQLYKENDGKVSVVKGDNRVRLLNDDPKDTLDAFQFKKQLIQDYLLEGVGYAYINKDRNKVSSLNYVDNINVTINKNVDPIFKDYDILVGGKPYRPYEFIKLIRKTTDGINGTGIIFENNDMLSVAYLTLAYEKVLMKTGGNKRGFLKASKKLAPEAITALKTAWNNLYKNNTENMMILNDGIDFAEASNTSVELQMNENKKTNSSEISKIFTVPYGLLDGSASEAEYNNFIKLCILPILKAFVTALNRDLLLESEKDSFYFAFDTKELMKGDLLNRFKAYEIAIKNGFMKWNEIRYQEDLEPYDIDFIMLGLQSVLYNPETKEIYTPNTNKLTSMNNPQEKLDGDFYTINEKRIAEGRKPIPGGDAIYLSSSMIPAIEEVGNGE